MKRLLSLLLCFVFLNAQSFAKHEMPGGLMVRITGTYGGVLVPKSSVDSSGATLPVPNSLGLFAFIMPQASYGSGATIFFDSGRIYSGTIIAMGNQNTLVINAIMRASYNPFSVSTTSTGAGDPFFGATLFVITDITANANGTMKATVSNDSAGGFLPTINGEAEITTTNNYIDLTTDQPVSDIQSVTKYTVDGVQQTPATTLAQAATGITLPTQ
jgi:hypothetical protein